MTNGDVNLRRMESKGEREREKTGNRKTTKIHSFYLPPTFIFIQISIKSWKNGINIQIELQERERYSIILIGVLHFYHANKFYVSIIKNS